jgi:hypothetical protein
MQRTEGITTDDCGFGKASLAPDALGINLHIRIQPWVESFDLRKVSLYQLDGRNLFLADSRGHDYCRKESEI